MKFNINSIKGIKTSQVKNFINSPAGFLTTIVVGGVVLAAAAAFGNVLNESIARRKEREREEMKNNSIEGDFVLIEEGEEKPSSDTLNKVANVLLS